MKQRLTPHLRLRPIPSVLTAALLAGSLAGCALAQPAYHENFSIHAVPHANRTETVTLTDRVTGTPPPDARGAALFREKTLFGLLYVGVTISSVEGGKAVRGDTRLLQGPYNNKVLFPIRAGNNVVTVQLAAPPDASIGPGGQAQVRTATSAMNLGF